MNLEPLTTVGEVAVAIAGFAGIIVVFGDRGRRGVPLVFRISTRGMLLCSLTVVFAAFVPFVFVNLGMAAQSVWLWSCCVLTVMILLLLIAAVRDGKRVKDVVPFVFRAIGGSPLYLALAFAAVGIMPVLGLSASALYLMALLTLLYVSAYHFVNIVMMYITPKDEAD